MKKIYIILLIGWLFLTAITIPVVGHTVQEDAVDIDGNITPSNPPIFLPSDIDPSDIDNDTVV
jgi:hypothetical protein